MPKYRIRDWDSIYENSSSRKVQSCAWLPIPNKQDGLGYITLLTHENGEALYGAFVAVVLKASKVARCAKDRHGWLTCDGKPKSRPLSCKDLAMTTHFSEETIAKMLEVCSTELIDWIEVIDQDEKPTSLPDESQCATSPSQQSGNITERTEGTEQKGKKEETSAKAPPLPLSKEALHLCTILLEDIRKNDPQFKQGIPVKFMSTSGWGMAARLLLERDKRPFEEACNLIHWCQADDFWHKNILSMGTFRRQYTRLKLAAKSKANTAPPKTKNTLGGTPLVPELPFE